MISRRMITGAAAVLALGFSAVSGRAQDKPTLTVYTYASFTGKYGPGAKVKAAFEKDCACEVKYVAADDAGALLGRLKLEGSTSPADVVLGLDMNMLADAKAMNVFAPHGQSLTGLMTPVPWTDETFLPFDWGHLAFIYDSAKISTPPASLKDLVENSSLTVVLQDPRTSAPGLGFLLWMQSVYGDKAGEAWVKLKPRIVTFTKGWSEAYGLFLKGEADMVLSYTTSPAYHAGVEKKTQYRAAAFAEGQYAHIETVAMMRGSKNPDLARRFLNFVISDVFQTLIPEGNWMMPAKTAASGLPASFADVLKPAKTLLLTPEQVQSNRRVWIDAWLNATSK